MEDLWIIILAILSTYTIVSLLLFIFPSLIHAQHRNISVPVKTCGHRGGAGEFIENTMPAFDNCVQLGIDMLEIDVQLTQDNVVVVAHDNDLFRSTGVQGKISDTMFVDLPPYKSVLPLDFDSVKCSSEQNDLNFVKLDELFEKHCNTVFHIDTKEGDPNLIHSVSQLITKHKRLDRTVWGNMKEQKNNLCYAEDNRIDLFFSIKKVCFVYVMFYLGIIGFVPLKESFFSIPFLQIVSHNFKDMLSPSQKIGLKVLDFLTMNRLLFWHLRRRGIKVVLFVLNSHDMFVATEKYNVDGIMTDFPSRLIAFHNREDEQDQLID